MTQRIKQTSIVAPLKTKLKIVAIALCSAGMLTAAAPRADAGEIGLGVTLTAAGGSLLGVGLLGFMAVGTDPEHYDDCYRLNGEKAKDACVQKHLSPLYGAMLIGATGLGVGIPLIVHGVHEKRAMRLKAAETTLSIKPVLASDGARGAALSFARTLP